MVKIKVHDRLYEVDIQISRANSYYSEDTIVFSTVKLTVMRTSTFQPEKINFLLRPRPQNNTSTLLDHPLPTYLEFDLSENDENIYDVTEAILPYLTLEDFLE